MIIKKSLQPNTHLNRRSVLLIHGLGRSANSMRRLALFLNREGYDCYLYQYPSFQHTIIEHSEQLLQAITQCIDTHQLDSLYLVTHSLGGIIAKATIAMMDSPTQHRIKKAVLLAPPNQGSLLATLIITALPFLRFFIKPLKDLTQRPNAYVHHIQVPSIVPFGIIAGRYDAKTPPASAYMKEASDFLLVNSAHTGIMNKTTTQQAIIHFFNNGYFIG